MKLRKLQNHLMYCLYQLQICERKNSNKRGHYFRRQIELTKQKMNKHYGNL